MFGTQHVLHRHLLLRDRQTNKISKIYSMVGKCYGEIKAKKPGMGKGLEVGSGTW